MKTTLAKLTILTLILLGGNALFAQSGCQSAFNHADSNCTVYFTDQSTGTNLNYIWLFGDGGSSNTQNPSHTYTASGTYSVCLIIYNNNNCSDSICQSVTVNCGVSSTCSAQFYDSAHFSNGCVVDFYHWNNSAYKQYLSWNWGDGTYGNNSTNAGSFSVSQHTYTGSGNYYVCLYVYDSVSQCSNSYCDTISVNCGSSSGCQAYFIDSMHYQCSVQYYHKSTGVNNNTKYSWNFGDGQTSTQPYPYHTYTKSGWYNVCLTITNSAPSCQSTYCDSIYVTCASSSQCQAYFIDSAHYGCTVDYFNKSTGLNQTTSYNWSFGDGGTGNQLHANHTYSNSGWYLVCLTISDSNTNCQSTFCDSIYVNCGSNKICSGDFSSVPDSANPCRMFFNNTSTGGVYTQWYWGDGTNSGAPVPSQPYTSHTYNMSGNYKVCIYLYDSTQQWCDSTCHDINVNCVTGISDIKSANNVEVYPNPASDYIMVQAYTPGETLQTIRIVDISGRVVLNEQYASSSNKRSINTSTYEPGMYTMLIETDSGPVVKRIIIK